MALPGMPAARSTAEGVAVLTLLPCRAREGSHSGRMIPCDSLCGATNGGRGRSPVAIPVPLLPMHQSQELVL